MPVYIIREIALNYYNILQIVYVSLEHIII